MTVFLARSVFRDGVAFENVLLDHLEDVGVRARSMAAEIGMGTCGYWTGRLHDLGKLYLKFLGRLNGSGERVDHSTAGAAAVLKLAPKRGTDRVIAELMAHCIAGHHAGLPDTIQGDNSLMARVHRFDFNTQIDPSWPLITQGFPDNFPISPDFKPNPESAFTLGFQIAFLGRMLFSMLVDSDYRSAHAFECEVHGKTLPMQPSDLREHVDKFLSIFDTKMGKIKSTTSTVSSVRSTILASVLSRSANPPGLYTLNVPTGGGKTLASLGFALNHAKVHQLKRIVYAIPFTSILDQTAAEFTEMFGAENVLQHYSTVERVAAEDDESRKRPAATWEEPLILTTTVQLFESLFAASPRKCRKLKNLIGSVIILDEVQALPKHLMAPCMAACEELARNYGCTIVFCTATQPDLGHAAFRQHGINLTATELSIPPEEASVALQRVTVETMGKLTMSQLAERVSVQEQSLVIMPTRRTALQLYLALKQAGRPGVLHISTRQVVSDRRRILAEVRRRLSEGEPCRLIATSAVEAGVHLDFPFVWRHLAGLDQIGQAAGRCNREGLRDASASIVSIFELDGFEPPPQLAAAISDTKNVLARHENPLSPQAIKEFFAKTFGKPGNPLDINGFLMKFRLANGEYHTDFLYRSVGKEFRLIDSEMPSVIIPPEGMKADDLLGAQASDEVAIRDLQQHAVQIPQSAFNRLLAKGSLKDKAIGQVTVTVLDDANLYNQEFGLLWEDDIEL